MTDIAAQPYPFDTDPPRKATREDFEAMARKLAEAEAKLKAAQLAPVPAQPAEAEGVEALAIDVGAVVGMEYKGGPLAEAAFNRAQLHEFARRLRNSPQSTGLLSLIADIRAAAGDPAGKMMQGELVAHIRALRKQAGRYMWLRDPSSPAYVEWIDCSHRNGIAGEALDDAIDAARSAGGDNEA